MKLEEYSGLDLVTYCGLWCGACPGFHKGNCKGCRSTEHKPESKKSCTYGMKKCCKEKGITHCGECNEKDCFKLKKLINSQKGRKEYDYRHDIPKNIEIIRREGLVAWLKSQEEKWRCPSCGGRGVFYNLICWDCKNPLEVIVNNNLAAPCGIYCGACRQYLLLKKKLLEKRGYKSGCKGCRIRNKNCAFIRRDCPKLKKNEIEFCYECEKFPCQKLKNLSEIYREKYCVDTIQNLKRNKEIGTEMWLKEQEKLYVCPKCGGEICVHDAECYDCGNNINPNKKR